MVVRDFKVRHHLEDFIGISGKLSEEIFRLIILVDSSKPLRRSHRHHAGNRTHFFPIEDWQCLGKGDAVPGDQTLRRLGTALVDIPAVPDRHHEREQNQRKRNADDRQHATALVAERTLGDETG